MKKNNKISASVLGLARMACINMLIGLTIATLIDYSLWKSWPDVIYSAIYSIIIGVALWKGNEFIYVFIGKKFPWLREPMKAVIWGILLTSVYSFLIVLAINYIWLIYIFHNTIDTFWTFFYRVIGYIVSSIILISLAIHAVIFYKHWKESLISEEQLKRESLAMQYETFKNQISPHFLFNSLNVLTSLIYNDKGKAVLFIDKLSEIYNYVLGLKDKSLVSLEEEIHFLENYIYLQKIRFENSLNVNINIGEHKSSMIIPLSVQMLLENAIKHNIVSESKPLHIKIFCENNYIVVKNNLQRKKTSKESSKIGLNNIKARYELLSNKDFIIIESTDYFTVKLPLLNAES